MSIRISKSKFVAGCKCLKRLYWQVHEPELGAEPGAAAEAGQSDEKLKLAATGCLKK